MEDVFALLVAALAAMDDRNPVEVRLRFDWALLQWSGYASADPAELAALLAQFCRGDIRQTTIDELLAFFSVPLDAPYAKEFLLSKTARKTMRQLLDKLLATHLSLRLKSTELLDAATVQFYP